MFTRKLFSLPEFFVVGKDVTDSQLNLAAQHFRCNRPPLWCWSSKSGAALVRMADIISTVPDRWNFSKYLGVRMYATYNVLVHGTYVLCSAQSEIRLMYYGVTCQQETRERHVGKCKKIASTEETTGGYRSHQRFTFTKRARSQLY